MELKTFFYLKSIKLAHSAIFKKKCSSLQYYTRAESLAQGVKLLILKKQNQEWQAPSPHRH